MTRKEAATKHAKLLRLARGTSNPHEAEAARTQAEKLAAEHGLGASDLEAEKFSAAFDELVSLLDDFVAARGSELGGLFGTAPTVRDVLSKLKTANSDSDKKSHLKKFTTVVRAASLFAGDASPIRKLKQTLDEVLRNHDLSI